MNKINISAVFLLLASFGVNAGNFLPIKYIKDGPFNTGKIEEISNTTLSFNDEFFKLSPTVKYSTAEEARGRASSFRKGDFVAIKMIKINNKRYVDHIYKMYKK